MQNTRLTPQRQGRSNSLFPHNIILFQVPPNSFFTGCPSEFPCKSTKDDLGRNEKHVPSHDDPHYYKCSQIPNWTSQTIVLSKVWSTDVMVLSDNSLWRLINNRPHKQGCKQTMVLPAETREWQRMFLEKLFLTVGLQAPARVIADNRSILNRQ